MRAAARCLLRERVDLQRHPLSGISLLIRASACHVNMIFFSTHKKPGAQVAITAVQDAGVLEELAQLGLLCHFRGFQQEDAHAVPIEGTAAALARTR